MAQKSPSFLVKLNSMLTYTQKYYLVCLFFLVSLLLIGFQFFQLVDQQMEITSLEQIGSQYHKPLRKLLEDTMLHQRLANRYQQGNVGAKSDMIALQATISDDFRRLESTQLALNPALLAISEQDFYNKQELLQGNQITKGWEELKKLPIDVDPSTTAGLYSDIHNNILTLMEHLNDISFLILDPEWQTFYIIDVDLIKLPESQRIIHQLLLLSSGVIQRKAFTADEHNQWVALQGSLKRILEAIKNEMSKVRTKQNIFQNLPDSKLSPEGALESYFTTVQKFMTDLDTLFSQPINAALPSLNEIEADGTRALTASFVFWDASNQLLDHLLDARLNNLNTKKYVYPAVAALISLVGFLLGLFFIKEVLRSIKHLDVGIRQLKAGELSARVDVLYQDEIGRASISFNSMADTFERIITQLRLLIDATKRLAAGDFSARVDATENADDDISQVCVSFNNMAQTFEEIISQLHQLGINLTTSATEIATASKQQETIIVEQEATTREISVTANEISSTAKEFANTVSEVSKVGEHTSTLASAGKESLSHMEAIMRQMVDASGSIASKLAVLNEKAGNITSVITTITKVADQTNLLSLNAAIEAEKAGEYGRSFAVIAREIRRLADQTALATLDIEKIVNEIMSAVSSSVMGVDDFTQEIRNGVDHVGKVGGQLSTIIEQVQVLTQRFGSVNQGMQTQSAAAEQINEAMAQLSHTARMTTESIHQFRNTIQQLNGAATDLRVAVSKIKHG